MSNPCKLDDTTQNKIAYAIGYEKGYDKAIDEFVKAMRKYWGGLRAMDEIERVGEQLKEQNNDN